MQMKSIKVVFMVAFATACSVPARGQRLEFAMCSDDTSDWSSIRVDFANHYAFVGDGGSQIRRCVASKVPCITGPFPFSVPPRLPVKLRDVVSWDAGAERFSIQLLAGSDNLYRIDVASRERTRSDLLTRSGAMTIFYRRDEGVVAYRETLSGHGWLRCQGNLTFEDVEQLSR